jgi:hypothetical protein
MSSIPSHSPDRRPPRWQYFLNPWWRERRTYFTNLSVENCRQRLSESTTRFLGRRVGRSTVSLADFTLHRMTFYANGGKPYAYVRLIALPTGGTLVRVSMSASLFGMVFLGIWFGFIGIWTIAAMGAFIQQGVRGLFFPVFGVGMAALGMVFNAATRLLAAGDPAFLLSFLREELDLREPPAYAVPIG